MKMKHEEYKYGGLKYTVYPNGDIYGPSGKKLKPRYSKDGYLIVTVGSKYKKRTSKYVHRIVAEVFLPNLNGYSDVDHIDGNRANPCVENLEWVDHNENIRRAYDRGGWIDRAVGEKNPKARLTESFVIALRKLYKAGVTIQKLADKYNLPWNTVGNAVKGITWKHLPM